MDRHRRERPGAERIKSFSKVSAQKTTSHEVVFGEPKASLTEYLMKNKEELVLLRFNFVTVS